MDGWINSAKNYYNQRFLYGIFLLYSFLPGIYKIFDNQYILLLNIPLILLLILRGPGALYKFDLIFLFYLFYILIQTALWTIWQKSNTQALFMGFYMSVIPMTGFILSRKISFRQLADILIFVACFHCFAGIILFPAFHLNIVPYDISFKLMDGVMWGRMSSVSGSLGFGSLLMIATICAFYYRRYWVFIIFLVCLILSLQRGAWLGVFFAVILYNYYLLKEGRMGGILLTILICLIIGGIIFYTLTNQSGLNFELLMSKFQNVVSAIDERHELWEFGIDNFLSYPLGTGVGQVGQVARFESSSFLMVPDGDYFRILSEFGIMGLLFYLFLISFLFFICLKGRKFEKDEQCIIAVLAAFSIQMIGSNVTEFYYNNFIYWIVVGYFFLVIQKRVIV